MTDVMTPEQRRLAMAHNRGRTCPELALASALWHRGLRYLTDDGYKNRYHQKLLGQPDIIFPRERIVIFIDGCFWHGCPQCDKNPGKSGDFWLNKINANVERDRKITACLEEETWTVIRVPEHDIRTRATLEHMADRLKNTIIKRHNRTVGTDGRS